MRNENSTWRLVKIPKMHSRIYGERMPTISLGISISFSCGLGKNWPGDPLGSAPLLKIPGSVTGIAFHCHTIPNTRCSAF